MMYIGITEILVILGKDLGEFLLQRKPWMPFTLYIFEGGYETYVIWHPAYVLRRQREQGKYIEFLKSLEQRVK